MTIKPITALNIDLNPAEQHSLLVTCRLLREIITACEQMEYAPNDNLQSLANGECVSLQELYRAVGIVDGFAQYNASDWVKAL